MRAAPPTTRAPAPTGEDPPPGAPTDTATPDAPTTRTRVRPPHGAEAATTTRAGGARWFTTKTTGRAPAVTHRFPRHGRRGRDLPGWAGDRRNGRGLARLRRSERRRTTSTPERTATSTARTRTAGPSTRTASGRTLPADRTGSSSRSKRESGRRRAVPTAIRRPRSERSDRLPPSRAPHHRVRPPVRAVRSPAAHLGADYGSTMNQLERDARARNRGQQRTRDYHSYRGGSGSRCGSADAPRRPALRRMQ